MRVPTVVAAFLVAALRSPISASPIVEINLENANSTPTAAIQARDFTNNLVFSPPANYTSWKTLYGRSAQLADGSLLVTWEEYVYQQHFLSLSYLLQEF
jgi:hypothetical protein